MNTEPYWTMHNQRWSAIFQKNRALNCTVSKYRKLAFIYFVKNSSLKQMAYNIKHIYIKIWNFYCQHTHTHTNTHTTIHTQMHARTTHTRTCTHAHTYHTHTHMHKHAHAHTTHHNTHTCTHTTHTHTCMHHTHTTHTYTQTRAHTHTHTRTHTTHTCTHTHTHSLSLSLLKLLNFISVSGISLAWKWGLRTVDKFSLNQKAYMSAISLNNLS